MKQRKRLFGFFLALVMVLSVFPAMTFSASAISGPEAAVTVWDMENVPEDLYEAHLAVDIIGNSYGHAEGMLGSKAAPGKGFDGSTAASMTLTENCTADNIWANGTYFRICDDETADADWYGVTEIWFWLDLREFANSEVELDFMVDGVHPSLDTPCYYVQNGRRTETTSKSTYDGAPYGREVFPRGFVGWVGFPASAFNTTFGKIQNIAFTFFPRGDFKSFPLSAYIDEFRIVREDVTDAPIYKDGELFNKDIDAGASVLYTNITDVHQKVKSYGASGAWWSTAAGTCDFVDNALKVIFTDEGAGLNNYRHNIGGSVLDDLSDAGNEMQLGRAVPSPLNENGDYEEDRDIGAYTVLMKLVELGTIDNFTLFINSPPSTMTKNAMTFGDPWEENVTNLRDDCYELFAEYCVDMVQLYNYLGVPVSYISPVNEPQYAWNSGSQEGCFYTASDAQKVMELVAKELIRRYEEEDNTLGDVKISYAESGNWSDRSFINYMYYTLTGNPEIASKFDHISAHSYGSDAGAKNRVKKELQNLGANVQLRQTEYAPGYSQADFSIKLALDTARVMYEDLSILDVDGWSYWLACGNGNYTDSLAYYSVETDFVQPTKRLWAMGQYARFTKGATRVGVDEYGMPSKVYTTAFVNRDTDSLVYVVVNESAQDETFSFAGLPAGSVADVYETSAIRDLELRGTMSADYGYTLPAQSVTTFVFNGLDITAVESGAHPDNPMGRKATEGFDYGIFDAEDVPEETDAPETVATDVTDVTETEAAPEETRSNGVLFGCIGGGAVLAAAAAAIVIARKKKKGELDDGQDEEA